jgi:Fe-S-cluster containining protein
MNTIITIIVTLFSAFSVYVLLQMLNFYLTYKKRLKNKEEIFLNRKLVPIVHKFNIGPINNVDYFIEDLEFKIKHKIDKDTILNKGPDSNYYFKVKNNGDCIFYSEKKYCKIYDIAPKHCVWNERCYRQRTESSHEYK